MRIEEKDTFNSPSLRYDNKNIEYIEYAVIIMQCDYKSTKYQKCLSLVDKFKFISFYCAH